MRYRQQRGLLNPQRTTAQAPAMRIGLPGIRRLRASGCSESTHVRLPRLCVHAMTPIDDSADDFSKSPARAGKKIS
jgi:hypothetical protein